VAHVSKNQDEQVMKGMRNRPTDVDSSQAQGGKTAHVKGECQNGICDNSMRISWKIRFAIQVQRAKPIEMLDIKHVAHFLQYTAATK
jgi:hypothetical protein